jgi:hypothetical protein
MFTHPVVVNTIMKIAKGFSARVCLFVVLSFIASASDVVAKPAESIQKQKKALVSVYVDDKNGRHIFSATGSLLDETGVVVTSCRVMSKWLEELLNTIVIRTEGGAFLPMERLISNDCNNNVALVKIRGSEFPTVKLAADHKPKSGEGIVVLDRTSGLEAVVSEGRIGNIYKNSEFFQVTVPAAAQRDGSPVFNAKGEVIGISTTLPGKKQSRSIVVPVKYVSKEFGRYKNYAKDVPLLPSASLPVTPPVPVPAKVLPDKKSRELPLADVKDKAEQEFLRGSSYDKAHMYKEAVGAYTEAVRLRPDYAEAYANLGVAYYRIEKYQEAVGAYKQAIKLKPNTQAFYNKLGATYIILGDYSKALDTFKQSVKVNPKDSETHFNLGVTFVIAGDKNGAIEEYIILKELDRKIAEKLLDFIY